MPEQSFDEFPLEAPAPAGWPMPGLGLIRRSVMVSGRRLSYVTGGSGPPILLLHGLGGCSYAWRYTLPILAQHFTVYALDMLGCGESDKPRVAYTLDLLADTVIGFLDALGIAQAHVIGHSLGGGVAMTVWDRDPHYIDRLVLVDSGGMGRAVHWLLRIGTLPGAQGILGALSHPRLRVSAASRVMERRRLRRLQVAQDNQQMMTVLDRLRDPLARYAFLSILRNVANLTGQRRSALEKIDQIDAPVLLIWGARDRTIPLEHGLHALARLPRAYLEILPNSYHRPQIESPVAFNQLILHFFAAEVWPPSRQTPQISREVGRVLRQERLRRRLAPWAPAALAAVPASITWLLGSRRRARRRRM